MLRTYPFSDPNPIPLLTSDARLYPYHSFEGYAHDPVDRPWKVVKLENDLIEVFVLPEVGGKVWGAVVKETGHEFIYRNEVMKFRNIALRGPWTSGGIEFNFGVIGHTPATATPVDYTTRRNRDGSASVFVGGTDLPSRTPWRVEIRLPADRAYFETNVVWHNPTPLEHPYYNWMTAAAFARDDLVMTVPGDTYLEHPGDARPWPVDRQGRNLSAYDENRFGPSKSYHVVGERGEFFGGYYTDAEYGFGHWARYEEMPGQKIWLWALSRQGGIWEELLTDDDGQYVEFQAGRLFVQYSPGGDVNPISEVGFEPGATDRWTETWFPVEGLGGLTDASREGAMHVEQDGTLLTVRVHAFGDMADTLRIVAAGRVVLEETLQLTALSPVVRTAEVGTGAAVSVELPALGLAYAASDRPLDLSRPFDTPPGAVESIPETNRLVMAAKERVWGRELQRARETFERALDAEPWNRDALLGLADLEYRRGRFPAGVAHVRRALQLSAYDAETNFVAGTLYRATGRNVDAAEAFGWAARSMAYRSAAYVQLGEIALVGSDASEALRYAELALDYDRFNLSALQVGVIAARTAGDEALAELLRERLIDIDPLHHFVAADRYVASGAPEDGAFLMSGLRGEYPAQEVLELAIGYVRRGDRDGAIALLELGLARSADPVLAAWRAWLLDDPGALPAEPDPGFAFPYRTESLSVLGWAAREGESWVWAYLQALNYWGRDRAPEAGGILDRLGDAPDYAPVYVSRAHLAVDPADAERDLRRAVSLAPTDRLVQLRLVQHLQREGRWEDAATASTAARSELPPHYDVDLLHVASLVELGRAEEAIAVLDAIRVLPSEHSSVSHPLFVRAHMLAAFDALDAGDRDESVRHAETARTWPERLGLGRPYEPEERLQLWVLGAAGGDRNALRAVAAADTGSGDRWAALTVAARVELDGTDDLSDLRLSAEPGPAGLAGALVAAAIAGEDIAAATRRIARVRPDLFADVDARLLLRALTLER